MKDPRIWEVIDKIQGKASLEFENMFPAKQPSKVVIRTKDGREFSKYLEYPKGDPREPMTMEDLDNKFNALSTELLSAKRQREIKEMIFDCNKLSAKDFISKLAL
jgi:2-methylcitrate dehydratase